MSEIRITHAIRDAFVTSIGDLRDVVKRVTFVVRVHDGLGAVESFFPVVLDDPTAEGFINHDDLTREQIMKWVTEKIDPDHLASLEHGLVSKLANLPNTQNGALVRSSLLDD